MRRQVDPIGLEPTTSSMPCRCSRPKWRFFKPFRRVIIPVRCTRCTKMGSPGWPQVGPGWRSWWQARQRNRMFAGSYSRSGRWLRGITWWASRRSSITPQASHRNTPRASRSASRNRRQAPVRAFVPRGTHQSFTLTVLGIGSHLRGSPTLGAYGLLSEFLHRVRVSHPYQRPQRRDSIQGLAQNPADASSVDMKSGDGGWPSSAGPPPYGGGWHPHITKTQNPSAASCWGFRGWLRSGLRLDDRHGQWRRARRPCLRLRLR